MPFFYQSIEIYKNRFQFSRKSSRNGGLALIAVIAFLCSGTALAAAKKLTEAQTRYQEERAACLKGQTNQDRTTCLREAGAALQEARRAGLKDSDTDFEQNALMRCDSLQQGEREACVRRVHGEGKTTGSVADGGIYREVTTIKTIQPKSSRPENKPGDLPGGVKATPSYTSPSGNTR